MYIFELIAKLKSKKNKNLQPDNTLKEVQEEENCNHNFAQSFWGLHFRN